VSFSDGVDAPFGAVMFATGRAANVEGLGLEATGVKLTRHGHIEVDQYSQTSVPSIYAVGDVTGRMALTPVAIREGQAFAQTVFGNRPTAVDLSLLGTAVFAEPEVSTIGLTETEASHAWRHRRLRHPVPADDGDPVQPDRPHDAEAHHAPQRGQGAGRSHRRARRGRDDPDGGDRPRHGRRRRPISTAPSPCTRRRPRNW
jgi:hypothetical protein